MRFVSATLFVLACCLALGQAAPSVLLSFDKKPPLAGSIAKATIIVTIPAGLHAYSNPPTSEGLISLAVTEVSGAKLKSVKYPPGTKINFAGERVGVYTGTVKLPVTLEVPKNAKGSLNIKVTVHYQLCNDTSCFAPGDVVAVGKLAVSAKKADVPSPPTPTTNQVTANQAPPTKAEPAPEPKAATPVVAATTEASAPAAPSAPKKGFEESMATRVHDAYQHGQWWIWLPLAVLVGILLNLTPCVYPVIAPTAGFIAKQSEGSAGGRFAFGLIFLIGAALVFGIVGTVFGLSGKVFGSLYQSAWFTVGLGVLMMVLALSMFDVYQIALPSSLSSGLRGRTGLLGAAVMGMFIGVAAVPCGGPVIALVAAIVGQTRDTMFGLFAFSAMGLGLGLPVGALITSGSLNLLARPGEWMVTVKHVLGLAVIASGIYFLSFWLGSVLPPNSMAWVWACYLILASFYLLVFDHTGRTRAGIIAFKTVVALGATFYAALALYPAIAGSPASDELKWESFTIPALDAALGKGKPVLVDFRADWCAKCVEIEKKTFSDPSVRPSLSKMVLFRGDLTHSTPSDWNARFKVAAIPVVLFYDGNGKLVRRFETFFDTSEFRNAAAATGLATH